MVKRVIVTGANGFIGSTLVKKLITEGINVIAIDIKFEPSNIPQSDLVLKIEMPIDEIDKMDSCLPEVEYDAFYHFAWRGVNGAEKAEPTIQLDNIRMTMNCACLAQKLGCKKFLCSGTVAEQSVKSLDKLQVTSGGMMYGVAKYCANTMLKAYCKRIGLTYIWMQFSNIYGPNNKTGNLISYTIEELKNNREATFGPAMQPYDFIYIDDLIEAVFRLGYKETNSDFYFIGSGSPRILKEYLNEIGVICNKENLIKIGVREDDGISYSMDMFNIEETCNDIGTYVNMSFEKGIKETIKSFGLDINC